MSTSQDMQRCSEIVSQEQTAGTFGHRKKRTRPSSLGSSTSTASLSSWDNDHYRSGPPVKVRRIGDCHSAAEAQFFDDGSFPPSSTVPFAEPRPITTEPVKCWDSRPECNQTYQPDDHNHNDGCGYEESIKTTEHRTINEIKIDHGFKTINRNAINEVMPRSSEPEEMKPKILSENNCESNEDRHTALYGDIVNGVIGFIVIYLHGKQLYELDREDPIRNTAICVWIGFAAPLFFIIPGVIAKNLWLSRSGMAAVCLSLAYATLSGWPLTECKIKPMMQGQVLMVIANVSLSFTEKIVRLAFIFGSGSFVSVLHTDSNYTGDVLPNLGGMVLVAVVGLYAYHFGIGFRPSIKASRLTLLALFTYSTLVDLRQSLALASGSSEQTSDFDQSFLRVVCVACLGLIDTGLFQKEVEHKEQLEVMVRDRTREIRSQHKQLRMVGLALQVSETAIAVTDKVGGRIVWTNAAFQRLCGKPRDRLSGESLGRVLRQLHQARHDGPSGPNPFDLLDNNFTDLSEQELRIGNSVFRLEVTPFRESSDCNEEDGVHSKDCGVSNDRFLMVFKDITSFRARELAEKEAREKAMMAKAMGDAVRGQMQ